MKRGIFICLATMIIVLDVWLYFKAEAEQGSFILLFGLVSAVGLPLATTIFFTSSDWSTKKKLSKLTKLSEIDDLIKKAETQEQKYEILQKQYKNLEKIIQLESEKYYLELRRKDLELKAEQILTELDTIENELKRYNETLKNNLSSVAVERLRRRMSARKEGNIIIPIGQRELIINTQILRDIPIMGIVLEGYLLIFSELSNFVHKTKKGA